MIFERFIKPKWEHSNPDVRSQAIASLLDQDLIAQLAQHDPDPSVRRTACKKIQDLKILTAIAEQDRDAVVREFVSVRLRKLLCGTDADPLPLQQRRAHLPAVASSRLLEQVAVQAKEPEMRLQALERIDSPVVLGEIAFGDVVAPIRVAAAKRLNDKSTLEQLKRKLGKKDKRVFRVVREKLKQIRQREAEPARINAAAKALCQRLEKLGRGHTWVQDRAILELLEKQWQSLDGQVEAELEARYQDKRRAFLEQYQSYRSQNLTRIEQEEALAERKEKKQQLLEQLTSVVEAQSESARLEAADHLPGLWEALGSGTDTDQEERQLDQLFSRRLTGLHQTIEQIEQRRAGQERLEGLSQQVRNIADKSAPIEAKVLKRIGKELAALTETLGRTGTVQSLEQGVAGLRTRFETQKRKAETRLSRLDGRLEELEQALERGGLKDATSVRQKIQADLAFIRLSAISDSKLRHTEQRLQRLLPRLVELQNWRRWGTDQHREELCEAMESLLESDLSPEALTFRLKKIQEAWKALDKSGASANRVLWQRFHKAADRVFEHCRPYFDAQVLQRGANRAEREALCEELEAFLEQVDWQQIDWKQAVRAEQRMRDAWRDSGPVEHKVRRPLEKRFRTAMRRLEKPLAQERARNQAYKQQLIEQARALKDEPDIEKAIQEAKRLQRRWHTTVAGKRKQENRIWQTFRSACDEVFARLDKQRQAQRDTESENAAILQGLCAEVESLVASGTEDKGELQQRFHALEARRQETSGLDLNPKSQRELTRRWQQVLRLYQARLLDIDRRVQRRELDLLSQRAQLCGQLEQHLDNPEAASAVLADLRTRWEQLPPLQAAELQQRIEARYQSVVKALEAGGNALETLRRNVGDQRNKREALCLRMEILAGVESPGEAAQQRLAMQVDRLTGHMQRGEEQEREQALQLQQQWYLLGPGDQQLTESLERRFQHAVSAMQDGLAPATPDLGRREGAAISELE